MITDITNEKRIFYKMNFYFKKDGLDLKNIYEESFKQLIRNNKNKIKGN